MPDSAASAEAIRCSARHGNPATMPTRTTNTSASTVATSGGWMDLTHEEHAWCGYDWEEHEMTRLVIYHRLLGGHVHVRVFSGTIEGDRALNGELVFSEAEWAIFQGAITDPLIEFREETHDT